MGVCEYRADKLFVYLGDVFLGVTIGGGGKSSEDVQASLCFGVDSVGVVPERHSSVIGHPKDGGGGTVWDRVTIGCWLYSRDQGVMRVRVDLEGETLSLLLSSHCSSMWMYS